MRKQVQERGSDLFNATHPGHNNDLGDILYTREDQESLRDAAGGRGRDREPEREIQVQRGWAEKGGPQGQGYAISAGALQ